MARKGDLKVTRFVNLGLDAELAQALSASALKNERRLAILRTFFERKGFTNEATNWLNVVIEVHCHFNRVMAYDHRQ